MAYDLDADLAEARGEETPFEFTFGGDTYTMPPTPPLELALKLTTDPFGAFEGLLGTESWERLLASPGRFDEKAYKLILTAYKDHFGVDMGESEASTDSSPSTAEQ